MKIFGFQIGKEAPAKTIVVAAEPTKQEPKRPKSSEIGDSGTEIFVGIVQEEHVAKLQNEQGVKVFDIMRKRHATV